MKVWEGHMGEIEIKERKNPPDPRNKDQLCYSITTTQNI